MRVTEGEIIDRCDSDQSFSSLPLVRRSIRLFSQRKRRYNNSIFETPDLEDEIHVEKAEEEEQDDKQASHLLGAPLFNRGCSSDRPRPERSM